jgi:hypothetical protein
MSTDSALAELIADAQHLPPAMLPRPRSGDEAVDLVRAERDVQIRIPDAAAALVVDLDGYGG